MFPYFCFYSCVVVYEIRKGCREYIWPVNYHMIGSGLATDKGGYNYLPVKSPNIILNVKKDLLGLGNIT